MFCEKHSGIIVVDVVVATYFTFLKTLRLFEKTEHCVSFLYGGGFPLNLTLEIDYFKKGRLLYIRSHSMLFSIA